MEASDKVIIAYKITGSIRAAAQAANVTSQKARKILISAGLYTTETISYCIKRIEQGASEKEIAEELGVGEKAVKSMLPYRKGEYNLEAPTKNAAAIRRHRERKGR